MDLPFKVPTTKFLALMKLRDPYLVFAEIFVILAHHMHINMYPMLKILGSVEFILLPLYPLPICIVILTMRR